MSHGKGFRANIILWGMPRDVSTLEVRAKLADLGLAAVEHSIRLETQFFGGFVPCHQYLMFYACVSYTKMISRQCWDDCPLSQIYSG